MSDYKIKYLSVFMSIIIMGFFINDIVVDYYEAPIKGWHFYSELSIVLLLAYLLVCQIREIYTIKKRLAFTSNKLNLIQGEISDLIHHKFDEWKLTKAERSVTWMVIKGFSFKRISEIRNVSEKTVHQQTASIYRKSGSKNRHELMSDFLDYFINSEE